MLLHLWFNLARILLHDDTNTNPDAGIVLLFYLSLHRYYLT